MLHIVPDVLFKLFINIDNLIIESKGRFLIDFTMILFKTSKNY